MKNDLKPLPAYVQWWRRTRNQRKNAYKILASAGRKGLTLAISVVGGTLISYGVWSAWPPAGYIVGGLICWLLLWSHEQDKNRRSE